MIDARVLHGIITTGACYIFVSIDPEVPSTLRYSVCRNTTALETSNTALTRVIAFALLAMRRSKIPMTDELDAIVRRAGLNWTTGTQSFSTDHASDGPIDAATPGNDSYKDDEISTSPESHYQAAVSGVVDADRPWVKPDPDHQRAAYPSPPPQLLGKRHRDKDDPTEQEVLKRAKVVSSIPKVARSATPTSSPLFTPPAVTSPPNTSAPVTSQPIASPPTPSRRIGVHDRKFCSPACIAALRHGESAPCPHRAEHERAGRLTSSQLRQRLHAQLTGPLDGTCEWDHEFRLLIPGESQAQIVKLWFKSHGYTIIAKAFQPADLHKMHREFDIYKRLKPLQSDCVR